MWRTDLAKIDFSFSNTFGTRIPLVMEYLCPNTFGFEYLWAVYRSNSRGSNIRGSSAQHQQSLKRRQRQRRQQQRRQQQRVYHPKVFETKGIRTKVFQNQRYSGTKGIRKLKVIFCQTRAPHICNSCVLDHLASYKTILH